MQRCKHCNKIIGVDFYPEFCNENCEGEYVMLLETGTAYKKVKTFNLYSSPAEKIESRFEILDL